MIPVSFLITDCKKKDIKQLQKGFETVLGSRATVQYAFVSGYHCFAGTRSNRADTNFIYADPKEDFLAVFDGAIFNGNELRARYPEVRAAMTDLELFVALYRLLGERVLKELNADFSAVVIDGPNVFVARDRLGVRPLFYSSGTDLFLIGSEVALLLEVLPNATIDSFAVRQYRKLRTFFNGRTLYREIREFPPGHYQLNDNLRQYWAFPTAKQRPPEDDELELLISNAVCIRSRNTEGCFLSGGLDSSIVAALSKPKYTWSAGFPDENEFQWAELVASMIGSRHKNVTIDACTFRDLTKFIVDRRREPLSVPNEVLLWLVCQDMASSVTAALSGEGADELFFGYDRIFRWAAENDWSLEGFDRHYSYGSHDDLEVVQDAIEPFSRFENPVEKVAAFFQLAHLRGLLRRVDFAGRQHGLAILAPFTDYRLVERMANVRFDYRMHKGEVKAPLKRIFRDRLPRKIVERKKVGFPVPLESIFHCQGHSRAMDCWFEYNLDQCGIRNRS